MTGGMAFILDEDKSFFDKCNRGLVNIDRIINEDMESHRTLLQCSILNHYQETKSLRSKEMYDDFDKYEQLFWLLETVGWKQSFKDGNQVLDFLKAFNKDVISGKGLSKETLDTAGVTLDEVDMSLNDDAVDLGTVKKSQKL